MDEAKIKEWRSVLRDELSATLAQLEALNDKRASIEKQLELLGELLASLTGTSAPEDPTPKPRDFKEHLVEILLRRPTGMHIDEIRSELERMSIRVPGKGADANLIAHLGRTRGVHRIGRGTYAIDSEHR